MFRLVRILAFVGAGVLLIVGGFNLPWATYNNLFSRGLYELRDESFERLRLAGVPAEVIESLQPLRNQQFREHQEFVNKLPSTPEGTKYNTTISSVAFLGTSDTAGPAGEVYITNATGYFAITAYTFKRGDGAILKMAGDRDRNYGYRQMFDDLLKDSLVQKYTLMERLSVASDFVDDRGVHGSPYTPYIPAIAGAVLMIFAATITRAKPLTLVLALPAVVCGFVPLVVTPGFIADMARLREYGIVLDPALGIGAYVMLAGSALAAAGAALVRLEPVRPAPRWEMGVQLIIGAGLVLGSAAGFWQVRAAFEASRSYAAEANEIETQLKTNEWHRPRVAGEELVQSGRAAAGTLRTKGILWGGGAVTVLLIGGFLLVEPRLKKKQTLGGAPQPFGR